MCNYNVAIDDAVMKDIRPTITEGMEEGAWVQLQVEMLFSQMAANRREKVFDDAYMSNLISQSASSWKGVSDADEWIHDLRGE